MALSFGLVIRRSCRLIYPQNTKTDREHSHVHPVRPAALRICGVLAFFLVLAELAVGNEKHTVCAYFEKGYGASASDLDQPGFGVNCADKFPVAVPDFFLHHPPPFTGHDWIYETLLIAFLIVGFLQGKKGTLQVHADDEDWLGLSLQLPDTERYCGLQTEALLSISRLLTTNEPSLMDFQSPSNFAVID
jgi:hypothetical protein